MTFRERNMTPFDQEQETHPHTKDSSRDGALWTALSLVLGTLKIALGNCKSREIPVGKVASDSFGQWPKASEIPLGEFLWVLFLLLSSRSVAVAHGYFRFRAKVGKSCEELWRRFKGIFCLQAFT